MPVSLPHISLSSTEIGPLTRLDHQTMGEVPAQHDMIERHVRIVVVEPNPSGKVADRPNIGERRVAKAEELLTRREIDEVGVDRRSVVLTSQPRDPRQLL